ncbi:hypothetical protein BDQ17DRAFT_1352343 [Cyathus striatus]|nr:hypothetical protein BDQ17DRAFT_1352343 [Cyathus striatus]
MLSSLLHLRRQPPLPYKRAIPRSYNRPRYRSLSTQLLTPTSRIYVSKSTDPYFNLTLEDWLFKHHPVDSPLLLLYRDEPCVVIGRNQNPWKEVNLSALRKRPGVPFIRRRSGGGTVYHDLGNTNFSLHLPRLSFDRHVTAQTILRAVRSLAIDARVNDRNDICVGTNKISSAYKIVNKRAYHHGTMLISTQLDTLGDLLRTNKETMITKGVASVRSPVCNLQQFSSSITHGLFCNAVIAEFRNEYGVDDEVCFVGDTDDVRNIDYIRKGMLELPDWEWAYGQTPEFSYTLSKSFSWGTWLNGEIKSKHGIILSCALQVENYSPDDNSVTESIAHLGKLLEGQRYAFIDDAILGAINGPVGDVRTWLWSAMES